MTYVTSQNYTNMVVGKHGIQTFKVTLFVVLFSLSPFDVFIPANTHPLVFGDKWFIQIYLNVN